VEEEWVPFVSQIAAWSISVHGGALSRCLVLARLVADLVEAVSRYERGLVHPLGIIGLELEQSKYV
jgi:hypothetical protein